MHKHKKFIYLITVEIEVNDDDLSSVQEILDAGTGRGTARIVNVIEVPEPKPIEKDLKALDA